MKQAKKTDEMKNFGKRVYELLEEQHVDKAEFDRKVGIIAQSRYDWRDRGTIPNAVTAYKVAKFFNVSLEYLLTGENGNPLKAEVDSLKAKIREIKDFVKNA